MSNQYSFPLGDLCSLPFSFEAELKQLVRLHCEGLSPRPSQRSCPAKDQTGAGLDGGCFLPFWNEKKK